MGIEVFQIDGGGWAYRVGGTYQPFDPEQPGHVAMTEMRARELAEAEAARIEASE